MSFPTSLPLPESRVFGNLLSNTLQSQVDGTNILRRRVGTNLNQRSVNFTYLLTGEQFDDFIDFFEDTINQGFNYFEIPLLEDTLTGKIVNGYTASPAGLYWRLNFNFITLYSIDPETGQFTPAGRIVPPDHDFQEWCPYIDDVVSCTDDIKNLMIINRDLFTPL